MTHPSSYNVFSGCRIEIASQAPVEFIVKRQCSCHRRSPVQQQRENTAMATLEAAGLHAGELGLSLGRHFSLRDLVKWCRRMLVRWASRCCLAKPMSSSEHD